MTSVILSGAARRSFGISTQLVGPRSKALQLGPKKGNFINCAALSTNAPPAPSKNDGGDKAIVNKRQPFVTTEIEPGEWDQNMKDPLHRPKFRSQAKILSKEDWENQNWVTFEEQYATFADAGVTLSWIDHPTQKRIYESYLSIMTTAQDKFGATSHEYACRLLGQKFNITPFRAAAIVQLQHNEEQYKMNDPDRELLTKEASIWDAMIKNTIKQAYNATGERPPEHFVEQITTAGGLESHKTTVAEDIMDVDQLTRDANVREQERAKLMINNHIYIEDKDDETRDIAMTKDALRLIKQKEKLKEAHKQPTASPTAEAAAAAQKEQRPRFKFVAQAINTRDLNPKSKFSHYRDNKVLKGRRHRNRFQMDWPENTLVEQNGDLRPANLAEVKQTSWKPVRHVQEFVFAGVKQGWLDRTVRSKNSTWGKKEILEPLSEGVPSAVDIDGNGNEDTLHEESNLQADLSGDDSSDSDSSDSPDSDDSGDDADSETDSDESDGEDESKDDESHTKDNDKSTEKKD